MVQRVIVSEYKNKLGWKNKLHRLVWLITYSLFFRFTINRLCNGWRRFVLRLFGAKIGHNCSIAPSVKIWAPWNLIMHNHSLFAENVRIYNPAIIEIYSQSIVSENVFLCTASHNISSSNHELITTSIIIEDQVWIAADAFIGMGVTIGQGAVVGARAAVFKDVDPWTVVGGNPAKFIKKRIIKQ